MSKTAPTRVIVDLPAANVDLYWVSQFSAPDPVIFVEHRGKRYLILSDLEFNRATRYATVDEILPRTRFEKPLRKARRGTTVPGMAQVVANVCRSLGARTITMPSSTHVGLADGLRALGLKLTILPKPFFPARLRKTAEELRALRAAQRVTMQAIRYAETILRESRIKSGKLSWHGTPLTSERIHTAVGMFLLQQGYHLPDDMIAAGGVQSTDPHHRGSGVLKPHQSIIIDIFPQHVKTRFYGDATRTFCKGTPSDALAKMYDTVTSAQEWAIREIQAKVHGTAIHQGIQARFVAAGFRTEEINGIKQGFIHGTGHGLGLEIHEEPVRIGPNDYVLQAGEVVTVEPGLYYPAIGGVRIEDVVCVTTTGATLLAKYPKRLMID